MNIDYQILLSLGGILLLGQLVSALGRRTSLPRVTLLLLFGMLIGPEGLNQIPVFLQEQFDLIAKMTLLMVGFLIGGKLTRDFISYQVNTILWISISSALVTAGVVFLGLYALGVTIELAILLSCIASATAPASTLDVVMESNDQSVFRGC